MVLLGGLEPLGGRALGLGDDLVVVRLRRLHQEPGLVAGVADDLLGVRGAVVEGLLREVAGPRGLGVELFGLVAQELGLLGERARLLLRLRLQLLGDPLGMTEQRCSLVGPGGAGGGFWLALHRDHPPILPEDRHEPEREPAQPLPAGGRAGPERRRAGTRVGGCRRGSGGLARREEQGVTCGRAGPGSQWAG